MSWLSMSNWWNRVRYRGYAPVYDYLAKLFEPGRKAAIDQLDLEGDERILILGAGTGGDLQYLPQDAEITAVDITPSMVRRTDARAADLGLEIDARVGDAQALDAEDDSFDVVLLHLVLSVVPDPESVVAETARVLDAEGQVSIYDKFVPPGTSASIPRRIVNPLARVLFSDLTRQLEPLMDGTDLHITAREYLFGDFYTVAIAEPAVRKPDPSAPLRRHGRESTPTG